MVRLPKQEPRKELGKSREVALRRYLSNEHALKRKDRWNSFNQGVAEYLQMGHAEKVPVQAMGRPVSSVYYLPMHGVLKEASSTTKLRIVFDASAKSTSGNSLNDILLSGLSLYPLLPTIVNRFRLHKIGMSGDISKMFREVCLHPEDFDLHQFLHREDSGEIIDCRMKRLTFASAYLASQVLRQLVSDYSDEFPTAAALIEQAFYIDDCLTGADTLQEACHIREELNQLLDKASASGGRALQSF